MAFRKEVTWNGRAVTAAMEVGAVQGLRKAAEHILGVSRARVPHEEGTLERSGVASVDKATLTGAVSYDTKYAARQHEELDWQHDEGRTAKYLEIPMEEEQQVAADIIGSNIRRTLK